ncbi:MAG: ACGX-repeat peptide [Clostridia bacterium]|nr:ACGX-repeat peptide [Clostridia bacterium]
MALENLAGWNDDKTAAACGTAGGASDEPAEAPAACGAAGEPEETPAACGSACGAGDQ